MFPTHRFVCSLPGTSFPCLLVNETFIHGLRNVDIKLNELAQTVLFDSSDHAAVLNMWQATIGC